MKDHSAAPLPTATFHVPPANVHLPESDIDYLAGLMLQLLATPSPTGRTDQIIQLVGDRLTDLGLEPELTRRGALAVPVGGATRDEANRGLMVHADTIGAIVREIGENGRLCLAPVGSHSARFAEGARATIYTDALDRVFTGTILPLKASGHRYGDEIDTQGIGWDLVELRLDEIVADAADVDALGINIGDHVAFDAQPVITRSGFVVSRHLDDKAGLAALMTAVRRLERDGGVEVPLHLLVTISEEVGHGASHGIGGDVAELVSVDNAVVAPGQASSEFAVTVAMQDMHGPFDYHLSRRLLRLCRELGLPHRRDVFRYYRSDIAAALEAGTRARAALVGVGIDASHGHERTHLDGILALVHLLEAYARSPLTFDQWDREPSGPLDEFPSTSVQPAPEQPDRRNEWSEEAESTS